MNESQMRILSADEWLRQEPETPREEQLFRVIRNLLRKIDELEAELGALEDSADTEMVPKEAYSRLIDEVEALRTTIDKVREALMEHEV